MKKYLIITLVIINANIYCQTIFGKVTYSIQPLEMEVKSENPKVKMLHQEMKKRAENQQYFLEFNTTKSRFYKNDVLGVSMHSDEKERLLQKTSSILYGTNDTYYYDKESSRIIIKKDDGNLFFLDEKQDWVITSESKKIGDYICYKATCEKLGMNRNGEKKVTNVIAWFAPILPYSFGPKDFNGLPGLILELHFYKSVFLATNIEVNTTSNKVIELPKGKMIDYKEYQKSFVGKI